MGVKYAVKWYACHVHVCISLSAQDELVNSMGYRPLYARQATLASLQGLYHLPCNVGTGESSQHRPGTKNKDLPKISKGHMIHLSGTITPTCQIHYAVI